MKLVKYFLIVIFLSCASAWSMDGPPEARSTKYDIQALQDKIRLEQTIAQLHDTQKTVLDLRRRVKVLEGIIERADARNQKLNDSLQAMAALGNQRAQPEHAQGLANQVKNTIVSAATAEILKSVYRSAIDGSFQRSGSSIPKCALDALLVTSFHVCAEHATQACTIGNAKKIAQSVKQSLAVDWQKEKDDLQQIPTRFKDTSKFLIKYSLENFADNPLLQCAVLSYLFPLKP